ncbi:thermonuclease family protein [Sphingomonas cavernae]|uniref:Thermonuclease family protein n=1 Tax=Sphingomonas cavernae TaxID=2320861 RepID=A0A418WJV5_9SPHN|nr:thermonuclease family protein [Sphingomonas cavernae]RJF90295.1 thermonuclease family protein [Sphingomonas cavernae]
MIMLLLAAALTGCIATDGDSIRCGGERIRLLAIDAPEMGACPPQRHCAPGDPIASRDNLRRLIARKDLRLERVGQDRYRRTLAVVHAGGVNLSCAQLRSGHAVYRRDWDDGLRIARMCR